MVYFRTHTPSGTITINIEDKRLTIMDGFNNFECRFDIRFISDFIDIIKNYKPPKEYRREEMHSTDIVEEDWFYGNFVKLSRLKDYVKALKDISIDTQPHKKSNLKRMTTSNLLDLRRKLEVVSVVKELKRKEGSHG